MQIRKTNDNNLNSRNVTVTQKANKNIEKTVNFNECILYILFKINNNKKVFISTLEIIFGIF